MAFNPIDQATDAFKSGVNQLAGAVGAENPFDLPQAGNDIYSTLKRFIEKGPTAGSVGGKAWTYEGTDWHKIFPYSFKVKQKRDPNLAPDQAGPPNLKEYIYSLPIPPQSVLMKMVPASKATPTVGGVVEETSDNVFWIVQLSGTTGTAVSRNPESGDSASPSDFQGPARKFRQRLQTTGLLSGVGNAVGQALNKVGGIADSTITAGRQLSEGNLIGAADQVTGAINQTLLPNQPYASSAVDSRSNGYTEMQELHRFLYTYSHLKASHPKTWDLHFVDAKKNMEFRAVLEDFNIQQNSRQPMLYRYNIQLRCWKVQSPSDQDRVEADRFGANGDLNAVNVINADTMARGFKSIVSTMHGDNPSTAGKLFLKPQGV